MTGTHPQPLRRRYPSVGEWVLGAVGALAAFIGLVVLLAGDDDYVGVVGAATWRVGEISPWWGYGIFAGAKQKSHWATLRFTPEAAQWVKDEQWHPAQQAKMAEDGSLTLRLPYADMTELAMDVLRHGEQVQVIEPAALAKYVTERHRAAAGVYA